MLLSSAMQFLTATELTEANLPLLEVISRIHRLILSRIDTLGADSLEEALLAIAANPENAVPIGDRVFTVP